jgi:chloride channel 3/4/5
MLTPSQDLLTSMNSYPFLDNKHKPIFTSELADIVHRVRSSRVIDITSSPLVPAATLRTKLELLHKAGELDGGLPIVRDRILVGLIPAPDLEFALDSLADEGSSLCLMAHVPSIDDSDDGHPDPSDFTPYIDPVSIEISRGSGQLWFTNRENSGTCGARHQVAYGSGVRVLREAGPPVHMRP